MKLKTILRKLHFKLYPTSWYKQKGIRYSQYSFVTWYGDNKGRTSYQIYQARFEADMVYSCIKNENLK